MKKLFFVRIAFLVTLSSFFYSFYQQKTTENQIFWVDHKKLIWDDYIARARAEEYKFLAWNVWAKSSAGSVGNQSAFIPIIQNIEDFSNIDPIFINEHCISPRKKHSIKKDYKVNTFLNF